jgi:hypothetical protein
MLAQIQVMVVTEVFPQLSIVHTRTTQPNSILNPESFNLFFPSPSSRKTSWPASETLEDFVFSTSFCRRIIQRRNRRTEMHNTIELWSKRVFASSKPSTKQSVPLSVIDATVANFAPTEVVLFYDSKSPLSHEQTTAFIEKLQQGLAITLDAYPQWCGHLHRSNYDPRSQDHTKRYGRLVLTFGCNDDPGVRFTVAKTTFRLSDIVPSPQERTSHLKTWNAAKFPTSNFTPQDKVSTDDLDDITLSSVTARVTIFACGGIAIALKFAHPLADAKCMSYFMKDWAAATSAVYEISSVPSMFPVFDPQLLDDCAAGDVNVSTPDLQTIKQARELPCNRFDWWASADDCPFPTKSTKVPDALQDVDQNVQETRMLWKEWDLSSPVSHYVLQFSEKEIQSLWQAASNGLTLVSKHDSLLAHVWGAVNRARLLADDDDMVHMDYTLGLRDRTRPKLPDQFVGSPLIIANISASGREASRSDPRTTGLGQLAMLVRNTIKQFTPTAVAAHIYDKSFEQCPQRLWQAFLGNRHLLVTSWIHTEFRYLDFGLGGLPRYVEAVMPKMDGLLQLIEAPVPNNFPVQEKAAHWTQYGVDVHLYLKSSVMDRMIHDPVLRMFDETVAV